MRTLLITGHFIVCILICKNILCQPTVFTKQWYKDTNCITDANDILTTLEFILVDLQRIRFDTKQIKDDTALIKTNFVRVKEDVNQIKTQNKRFIVTMNKFGTKLDKIEINNMDGIDLLLELNRTLEGLSHRMASDVTSASTKRPTTITNVPVSNIENEIPNEIIIEPVIAKINDNANIYIETADNELENTVDRLQGTLVNEYKPDDHQINVVIDEDTGYESGSNYDKDREYNIEIESFSGEKNIMAENIGFDWSGFDEEGPEDIAFQSDHFNVTVTNENASTDTNGSNPLNIIEAENEKAVSVETKSTQSPDFGETTDKQDVFTDCSDIPTSKSGIHIITPFGTDESFPVYCQLEDNEHWLVFQRRLNGEVDFYRNWSDYKHGFGRLDGEFWLGNEILHMITAQNKYTMRIDMWDWGKDAGDELGKHFYAESNYFHIDNETEFYRLHVPHSFYDYSGFGGSGLRLHAGPFMTYDKRHPDMRINCAQMFHTGWWFKTCVRNANLNGKYYPGGYAVPENHTRAQDGIFWRNIPRSLKKVEMKLKRKVN